VVIVSHGDPLLNLKHFFTREDPVKISHQPYPLYADPNVFYWDHNHQAQMDLHMDRIDDISWDDGQGGTFQRIPEVLDCWFESGSMPYSQSHFPFSQSTWNLEPVTDKVPGSRFQVPPGFPADFIAEGVDQTRAWFYVLMVLSTALFGDAPFRNVVVNGIVLAEDGKKMSKRLKNYPEPTEIAEKYGADAVRLALMSSPAVRGEDLRMSEKLVAESLRAVLLPLWNTYSFFVTYANAAGFEPVPSRRHSDHPLDRWIRAETQDLVNRMTAALDRYDLSATCGEIHQTIDALTNWYVRLSRRRFAGKLDAEESAAVQAGGDVSREEQHDALQTLHDVLLTVSQVLAPFCPFITDAVYLNLTSDPHGSVHLTDWPETRALTTEEQSLLSRNRLLRLIVSLGLSVRGEAKIRVRQPLREAVAAVPPAYAGVALGSGELELIKQELNVKEFRLIQDPGALADAYAQVDARAAGPRLGARVQEIIRAGKAGDFQVESNGTVRILDEVLGPEEVTIVYRGKEGQGVATDRGVVVSVDTIVTDDLEREGQARDLIRAVQRLRKEAGLDFTDRITLDVRGLDNVLAAHGELILRETNAQAGKLRMKAQPVEVEGATAEVRLQKIT
jgi:isoleucyl-tRNA synthetase